MTVEVIGGNVNVERIVDAGNCVVIVEVTAGSVIVESMVLAGSWFVTVMVDTKVTGGNTLVVVVVT